jgi:hypothetical protein
MTLQDPAKAPAPPPPAQVAGTRVTAGDPALMYRALRDQREILGDQQRALQSARNDLVIQLGENNQTAATRASLEKRIAEVDARIADLDKQIAASDRAVADAAGIPGATLKPPDVRSDRPDPDMLAGLSFALLFVIAIPITIAYARRIWRRSARAEVALPAEMAERMAHLERGVEAIALEVERIGEGQRFLTQALVERGAVPAIAAGAAREHAEPRQR